MNSARSLPKQMNLSPLRAIAGVLLLAGSIAAVMLLDPIARDSSLQRMQEAGTIRIGYAIEPPYAFVGRDGTVTGEAPEIAKVIAAQLGAARIEWRQMEFAELIDQLEAGQIDMVAAGMFITPERTQRVRFSSPTMQVRPGMLVAAGNPLGLESHQHAAQRQGVRFAVLAGSQEASIMVQLRVAPSRLVVVSDAETGRKAVESGLVDALILSEPTIRWMALTNERLDAVLPRHAVRDNDIYGQTAFAFLPDAARLATAWDTALRSYLGSPEHKALLAKLGLASADESDPKFSATAHP